MKKMIIAAVLAVGLATAGMVYAHGGYGYGGYGMGGYGMMGPGYGYGGYGMMGPGMMGGGYGNGYACPGYGGGYGNGGGYGSAWNNGWNTPNNQKFLDDTVQLRKQLNDKRFEYQEALRNPNTTREQLAKIEKDMIDLQAKISDKAQQDFRN